MKSIIYSEKGQCFLCERYGQTEEHHIFGASNRVISEKYGLKFRFVRSATGEMEAFTEKM